MKRRSTERFPLKLRMRVRWTTQSGIAEAHTESQDVSSRGIYFFLPKLIEDGSRVEIIMTLPREGALGTRILCQARVQRTEVIDLNRIGAAAQIEKYQFLRGNEDESTSPLRE